MRNTYIYQLPIEVQAKIKKEVIMELTKLNQNSEDNINNAMDGRLGDIEELI